MGSPRTGLYTKRDCIDFLRFSMICNTLNDQNVITVTTGFRRGNTMQLHNVASGGMGLGSSL